RPACGCTSGAVSGWWAAASASGGWTECGAIPCCWSVAASVRGYERRESSIKIVTVVAGSRGDVQPYIALGKGLQAAGHQVTIATHGIFREWIAGHGLGFAQVEGNPREMIEGRATGDWLASGRSGFRFVTGFREVMGGILQQAVSDAWQAVQGADLLIAS